MNRLRNLDPRYCQISILVGLLLYGVCALDFDVSPLHAVAMLLSVTLAQFFFTRFLNHHSFDPRSPLISGLSLCLLLRINSVWLAIAAAILAIGSKYMIRWRRKPIFNPTNFGIVVMLLLPSGGWVSSGQWGSAVWFTFLIAGLGGFVVNRATRSDITLAFLAFHTSILFGRAWWLGDPLTIPIHQLQSEHCSSSPSS